MPKSASVAGLVSQAASVGVHDGWDYGAGRRDVALLFRDELGELVVVMEDPPPDDWADEAVAAGRIEVRIGQSRSMMVAYPG